ncbi:hypothetical protein DXG03_002005 [Asterophora parasitica]|uniref:Sm domain-containing protein n=1 Tax=Asterophora parasitica TaxID=117018 RepID=A0A9P7GAH9_9AGAR|nr:hypothetical protein DXG03_002005 [Asterophora parasitica]
MLDSSPPTQPSQTAAATDPALTQLKTLLTRVLRVTVNDGRIFIGTFAGTDQPLNILLLNAEEYRLGVEENPDGRYVGQIVIPWKIIVTVEGESYRENRQTHDQMFL